MQNRKKNLHELQMNRIMYSSTSMSQLISGEHSMIDNSGIYASNSKLESYREVGKQREESGQRKHMDRRIKENQSSL